MEFTRRSVLSWVLGGSIIAFVADLIYHLGRYLLPPQELIGGGSGGKQTIIPIKDLPPETSKVLRHEGKLVIVVRRANEVYAMSAVCPHLGCIVHWEKKDTLYCPCHDGYFDLKTGKVLSGPPPRPLPTYPVRVTQDQIVIGEA